MPDSQPTEDERMALPVADFISVLTAEEQMLVRIRDELYEGSWDIMRLDLENRLAGKPYIFKLVSRIEHDLAALELLSAYEKKHGVDLSKANP